MQEVACCGLLLIDEWHEKIFDAELFEVGLDIFYFLHFMVNLSLILHQIILKRGNRVEVGLCDGGSGVHNSGGVFAFGDLRCA